MGPHYGWMHDMMGWGIWMIPWGWILLVILVVILIYAVAGRGGVRATGGPYPGERQASETPLEILKKRYVKGEISKEEFEQMKKDISE